MATSLGEMGEIWVSSMWIQEFEVECGRTATV